MEGAPGFERGVAEINRVLEDEELQVEPGEIPHTIEIDKQGPPGRVVADVKNLELAALAELGARDPARRSAWTRGCSL